MKRRRKMGRRENRRNYKAGFKTKPINRISTVRRGGIRM